MSDFIGTKLTMNLGERSYDIIVKRGSLENLYQLTAICSVFPGRTYLGTCKAWRFDVSSENG